MSCEHAQTTTLLWLYGEGDEAHEEHLLGCPECQRVVAEHEGVGFALREVGPALSEAPAPRHPLRWAGLALALAAGAALWLRPGLPPEEPPPVDVAAVQLPPLSEEDPLDQHLDALDWDLEGLSLELSTL